MNRDELVRRGVAAARSVYTLCTNEELECLAIGAIDSGRGTCVEIGSFAGGTTKLLASICSRVLAVENFCGVNSGKETLSEMALFPDNALHDSFHRNLADELSSGRVVLLKYDSFADDLALNAVLKHELRGTPGADMVFIDGAHDEEHVYNDVLTAINVVRPGGLICGHDIDIPSVRVAVDRALKNVQTVNGGSARHRMWWTYYDHGGLA